MGTPFTIRERVRWSDCDPAQIIYYGAYIRFFEIAETEMYRTLGLPYATAFQSLGCFPIRGTYHCEYRFPARLDDLMEIAIWVSYWGERSLTISFRFNRVDGGELLAEGYCKLVTVGLADKRPVPIPDRLREGLRAYTVIDAPASADVGERGAV
ncbi:MAG: thioesterase [Chlorobi bacterium]|nr:thioesterase [Chlorobiota bacterium]